MNHCLAAKIVCCLAAGPKPFMALVNETGASPGAALTTLHDLARSWYARKDAGRWSLTPSGESMSLDLRRSRWSVPVPLVRPFAYRAAS